jgi:hypothetical protein
LLDLPDGGAFEPRTVLADFDFTCGNYRSLLASKSMLGNRKESQIAPPPMIIRALFWCRGRRAKKRLLAV